MLLEPRRRSSSVTIGVINRQRLTTDEIHGVHKTPSTSRSWKRSEEIGQHIKRRLEFDVVIDLEGEKIPPSRHVVNIMSASTTPACLSPFKHGEVNTMSKSAEYPLHHVPTRREAILTIENSSAFSDSMVSSSESSPRELGSISRHKRIKSEYLTTTSNLQLHRAIIFNGRVMYKSASAVSYEPAWMRFKESTSILTIYSDDPFKSTSSVKTIGFIEVSQWSMRSKQSSKRVRLEITSNDVPHRFRFDSVDEAMKLVEALDRCLGHYEAHLATQSPSPLVRRTKSYRHPARSQSGVSDSQSPDTLSSPTNNQHKSGRRDSRERKNSSSPSKSNKFNLSNSAYESQSVPVDDSTSSTSYKRSPSRSDASKSTFDDMSSPQKASDRFDCSHMTHSVYDHHHKKTTLKSILKGSPTALYIIKDGGNRYSAQCVSNLIQRDGAFLRNRGIKIVVVGCGIKKISEEFQNILEASCYEDKTGQLVVSLCQRTSNSVYKDCVHADACFLLFDQTRDIIFSSPVCDKRPGMDEIVDVLLLCLTFNSESYSFHATISYYSYHSQSI